MKVFSFQKFCVLSDGYLIKGTRYMRRKAHIRTTSAKFFKLLNVLVLVFFCWDES